MIEVLVNIVPGGDRRRTREIASLEIVNESELAPVSDYSYRLISEASPVTMRPKQVLGGSIKNHWRASSIWELVAKILDKEKDRL